MLRSSARFGFLGAARGHDGVGALSGRGFALAKKAVEDVSERTARLVSQAIRDHWRGSDASLANAAGVSSDAISKLKTNGVENLTRVLRDICSVLGIDPTAILKGEINVVEDQDVIRFRELLKSEHETTLRTMVRTLHQTAAARPVNRLATIR